MNNNNGNWVDAIGQLIENYNNTVHTATKAIPSKILNDYNDDQKQELNQRLNDNFKKRNKLVDEKVLAIGTKVRIVNKQRLKQTIKDKSEPYWIDKVYEVESLVKGNRSTFSRNRYKVKDTETSRVLSGTFNISQLQVVEENETDAPIKRVARPRVIGRLKNVEIADLKQAPQTSGSRRLRRSSRNKNL